MTEKIREYIEKNNLVEDKEANYYTDGYMFVAKKDDYVLLYLNIIKSMINDKRLNLLKDKKYDSPILNKLKEQVLNDPINELDIIDEDSDYIVFCDSLNLKGGYN